MNPFAAPVVFMLGLYLAVHESMCVALGTDPGQTPDVFDLMGFEFNW